MNTFYNRLKIFYTLIICFLCVVLIPTTVANVTRGEYKLAVLPWLILPVLIAVAGFILVYYRNIVVAVDFDESGNAIVKTNAKAYVLPVQYFQEVIVMESMARTIIRYDDGMKKKKFVYQMKYSPVKTYHLDIDEMKKHMTSAKFEKQN